MNVSGPNFQLGTIRSNGCLARPHPPTSQIPTAHFLQRQGRKCENEVPGLCGWNNLTANTVGRRISELSEVALLDEIDDLARDYKFRSGADPIYISHWDPSEHVAARLREFLPCVSLSDPVPYTYSYLLKRRPEHWPRILAGLGVRGHFIDNHDVAAQIFENGTTAISAVSNWLKEIGIKEVVLLCPRYFSIPRSLRRLGLSVREIQLSRAEGKYTLPNDLTLGRSTALWLTHPVYSTGVYSLEEEISKLTAFADQGTIIVADESLALPPSKIAQELAGHPNFIGIYTPHKAICMNGLKFSMIVYHSSTGDTFDHWSDVLSGGLSLSAIAATEHFLGSGFARYRDCFLTLIEETRTWVSSIVARSGTVLETDRNTRGHFMSVYVRGLSADLTSDLDFLKEMLDETACCIIPGLSCKFDPRLGFSFRISLAQDSPAFRDAIENLTGFLIKRAEGDRFECHRSAQGPDLTRSIRATSSRR